MRSAVLAPALLLAATAPAQTVLLRYRPPVGKTVAYTIKTSMTMSSAQKMPGMKGPMAFSMSMPMTVRVISRTADTTTIEMKTGPAKMGPGSTMPVPPQSAQTRVVRMTMDQFGTPKGGVGAGPGMAVMNSMGQNMQGVVFPKRAVKVGDAWSQTIDMGKIMSAAKVAGPMKIQGKLPILYRLAALKNGIATIAMTSKGNMTMAMGAQPIRLTMALRSTVMIDTATGLAKSTTMVSDTDTLLPGMGAMRQHMTMSMK